MKVEVIKVKSLAEKKEFVKFPLRLYKKCPQFVPPLFSDEMKIFTDKNAYITAEGAIQFVMQSLQKTLRDSAHLIIGGGRIAKHLFIILRGFGASVTLACRDGHDLRWAEAFGAKAIDLLGESEDVENGLSLCDVIYTGTSGSAAGRNAGAGKHI